MTVERGPDPEGGDEIDQAFAQRVKAKEWDGKLRDALDTVASVSPVTIRELKGGRVHVRAGTAVNHLFTQADAAWLAAVLSLLRDGGR